MPPEAARLTKPSDEEIRLRAYFISEDRRRFALPGDADSDWREAKQQLLGGTTSISSATTLATYTPKPEYPSEARTRHITGSGVCVAEVDPASGNVTAVSMAESTGNPLLDDSAVRTFRKWRFKPRTVSRVRIPIEFR